MNADFAPKCNFVPLWRNGGCGCYPDENASIRSSIMDKIKLSRPSVSLSTKIGTQTADGWAHFTHKSVRTCLQVESCSTEKIMGLFTQKNLKNLKKSKKSKEFFWGFKIRIPYLGVNNSSISVFKSFFIYKILVHSKKSEKSKKSGKKSEKSKISERNPKNLKKPEKIRKI